MSAEGDLWASFWATMFHDACGSETFAQRAQGSSAAPIATDAVQAWYLLTDTKGQWAEQREYLAGICGFDPKLIRDEAIRRGPSRPLRAFLAAGGVEAHVKRGRKPDPIRVARDAAVAADYMAGVPATDIAARHGVAFSSVRRIAAAAGCPAREQLRAGPSARKGVLRERGLKIAELYNQGMRGGEIAKLLGLPRDTVDSTIHRWKRAGKLPGSAVADRGISRAAGGVVAPFHAQNMPRGEAV